MTLKLKAPAVRAQAIRGPVSWVRGTYPTPRPVVRLGPRQRVGWGHGEQLTFTVRLAGVEGGRAAISVGRTRKRAGRRVTSLRGLGETVPFISTFSKMSEEVVTRVDLAGMTPLRTVAERKAGQGKDRWIETSFGQDRQVQQTIKRRGRTHRRTRRIMRPLFDPISALYALRSMRWSAGAGRTFLVLSGTSLYRVELRAAGKERIYTRLGPRDTLRIDGIGRRILDDGRPIAAKKPRKLSIWLTADRARVPVRVFGDTKLGPIEALITSYAAPRRRARVRVARSEGPAPPKPQTGARRKGSKPRAAFGTRR